MSEIEEIVRGLSNASKRAIVKMGAEWIEEGHPGPSRKDAYSLWWGRDGKKGLVNEPRPFAFSTCGCSWKWRLTKLGERVREALLRKDHP